MAIRDAYDVVILGVGPAGLQAAVHAGRRKASVLLLGSVRKSSLFTAHIENYFSLLCQKANGPPPGGGRGLGAP